MTEGSRQRFGWLSRRAARAAAAVGLGSILAAATCAGAPGLAVAAPPPETVVVALTSPNPESYVASPLVELPPVAALTWSGDSLFVFEQGTRQVHVYDQRLRERGGLRLPGAIDASSDRYDDRIPARVLVARGPAPTAGDIYVGLVTGIARIGVAEGSATMVAKAACPNWLTQHGFYVFFVSGSCGSDLQGQLAEGTVSALDTRTGRVKEIAGSKALTIAAGSTGLYYTDAWGLGLHPYDTVGSVSGPWSKAHWIFSATDNLATTPASLTDKGAHGDRLFVPSPFLTSAGDAHWADIDSTLRARAAYFTGKHEQCLIYDSLWSADGRHAATLGSGCLTDNFFVWDTQARAGVWSGRVPNHANYDGISGVWYLKANEIVPGTLIQDPDPAYFDFVTKDPSGVRDRFYLSRAPFAEPLSTAKVDLQVREAAAWGKATRFTVSAPKGRWVRLWVGGSTVYRKYSATGRIDFDVVSKAGGSAHATIEGSGSEYGSVASKAFAGPSLIQVDQDPMGDVIKGVLYYPRGHRAWASSQLLPGRDGFVNRRMTAELQRRDAVRSVWTTVRSRVLSEDETGFDGYVRYYVGRLERGVRYRVKFTYAGSEWTNGTTAVTPQAFSRL